MSDNAFHEKAGRSQVDWFRFLLDKGCSPCRVGHCRHASIRTLEERLVSLGACGAFSVQPVLPSVWRPVVLAFETRTLAQALDAVTGTRLWLLSSWNDFDLLCFSTYAAAATATRPLLCNGSYTSPLSHK